MLKSLEQDFVTDLYKAFIQDVLALSNECNCAGKFLYFADPDGQTPFLDQFSQQMTLCPQKGVDLGERMHQALIECQSQGYQRMVIIGTDCIEISPPDIHTAFEKLEQHDYCIGPSMDGGYYLIGTSKPLSEAFTGIDWGNSTVREATLTRLNQLKQTYALLDHKEDMDTIESVKSFMTRMATSQAIYTTKLLSTHGLNLKKLT